MLGHNNFVGERFEHLCREPSAATSLTLGLSPTRQPTSISLGTPWRFDSSFRPHEHDLTGYDYAAVMPKLFQ